MFNHIRTIARYTLLEALRNRLSWLILVVALAGIGISGFLYEIALTEKTELQLTLLSALLRFSAVFLVATFVVTSMVREINDKGLQLVLAMPVTRAGYLLGKLTGFALISLLPVAIFGALIGTLAPVATCLMWALSLCAELWIVAAFSVLCVLTFSQVMPALFSVMGFYVMARSIAALQLMGHQPLLEKTPSQRVINAMLDTLSALLPHLDRFTRSDWLVYGGIDWHAMALLGTQSVIYLALLCGAALFDMYRKNI